MEIPPPILVETPAAWDACRAELEKQTQLAIDTESNSLYVYREQVCLIQISIPGRDFIIDPLQVPKLDGLGALMSDTGVEKIFHAAEYDLLLMKQDFGFRFNNLFDTMLAARILGWKKLGLASILKQEYDVQLDKHYQRANWGRRPLTPEQIGYARLDTYYLARLRDLLAKELEAVGRTDEALESFQRIAEVTPTPRTFSPDDFWNLLNGRYRLTPQQQAVLRELYIFREREAQRRNLPPFKIFSNRTMIELAEALPHFPDECQGIFGLTNHVLNRYGRKLLQVIQDGLHAEPPAPPTRQRRPPRAVLARFEVLHTWRKQRAAERGVESDVIFSKEALWEMAYQDPKCEHDLSSIKSLGDWQRERYGSFILKVLEKARKNK